MPGNSTTKVTDQMSLEKIMLIYLEKVYDEISGWRNEAIR